MFFFFFFAQKHLSFSVCKYRQTEWSECDPVSNKKTMIKTLKSGKPSICQPTETIEKLCKRKKKGKKKGTDQGCHGQGKISGK